MRRYPGLDLLRAIAILWVMLFHASIMGIGNPWPPVARFGWMGVDLFFVLSGYLIGSQVLRGYASGQPETFGDFYLRRTMRILPVYWVVLGFYFLLPVVREEAGIQPLWQFLTFTENFLVDYGRNQTFSQAWSLCVEEHFYLLFPGIVWLLMRRPSWRRTALVAVGILAAGLALRAYLWIEVLNPGQPLDATHIVRNHRFIELLYYPTYVRLDGLLMGVLLAATRWFRPAWWETLMKATHVLLLAGLGFLAAGIWLYQDRAAFWPNFIGYPVLSLGFALLVAASVSPWSPLDRFRVPGAGAVAVASYSLYLTHKQVFRLLQQNWAKASELPKPIWFLIYAGTALAVAGLMYFAVERPFLRWRDRLKEKRKRVPMDASAALVK